MRSAILLSAFAGVLTASAQLSLPFGLSFSASCQSAVLSVLTNGSFAQCFPVTDLIPIVSSNTSIIPPLDKFMTDLCYNDPPCSNATLEMAANMVLAGCASDLAADGFPNATVPVAFDAYPLVREILCLKTTDYYTNASYGGALGQAPIPVSSAYNETDGVFCVTSVLTQLSAYFGANLTLPYLESILTEKNTTALQLVEGISPTILCSECFFAAIDIVEEVYPSVGDLPLATIFGVLNATVPAAYASATINDVFNGTCSYKNYTVTDNGTIPANTSVSIINSTFPYNVTNGTATFLPGST